MDNQTFCLKWDGFQGSVTSTFDSLRQDGELVDVTLCCEGRQLRAHRMMLSACSPYFRDLLKSNPCQQMVIFLKDTPAVDLDAVIEFMYKGCVNVSQSQLASFIKTAEMLQIRGLSGEEEKGGPPPAPSSGRPAPAAAAPPVKRRRLSGSDSGRRSPASPGQRPRTPTPPPGLPLAPPPPPPAAAAPKMEDLPLGPPPTEQHATPQQQHQQQYPESVKVEKIDLTEEEGEPSLDSTLYQVSEYEGGYDGSNSGMDPMPGLLAAELGGRPPLGAGPSQPQTPRPVGHPPVAGGTPGEDGSAADRRPKTCYVCFKQYKHYESLVSHMKVHMGLTACPRCDSVCGTVKNLRRHLGKVHGLSLEEVWQIVPTRPKNVPYEYVYPSIQ